MCKNNVYIMFDTCVYSYLMNGVLNKTRKDHPFLITREAISNLLLTGMCPFISDMTFTEIVCGINDVLLAKKFVEELKSCEFVILGTCAEMKEIIEDSKNIILSSDNFCKIKSELIECKKNFLKPHFNDLLFRYCLFFYFSLSAYDKEKWGQLFFAFLRYTTENSEHWKKDTCDFFEEIYSNKERGMLFNFAYKYISKINEIYHLNYESGVIEDWYKGLNSNNFLKITKNMFRKHFQSNINKQEDKARYLMKWMSDKSRKNKEENNFLMNDAINYIVCIELFEGKLFELNDLIDAYNISLLANQNLLIKYHTCDKKWLNFINYERLVNIHFDKYITEVNDILNQRNCEK